MQKVQIKNFKNYTITNDGRVFGSRGELKPFKNNDGYFVVNLWDGVKYHHKRINRLVAEAFIENPDNLPIVNHIDHNRENNNVDNLEWCTEKHNSSVSAKMFPERWKMQAKITREQAEEVCKLIENGCRNLDISEMTGISVDTIKHIRKGTAWNEVSCNYRMTKSHRGISEATARFVCQKIAEGYKNREILEMSTSASLSMAVIKNIRAKRSWAWVSCEYFQ
jgi:hypothetical protein